MAYRPDLFSFALNQLRNGKAQEEASEKLNELITACRETGTKGKITLEIEVRPDKGDSGQYFLRPSVKIKKPTFAVSDTLFWGTPEGNLQRTDPAQGDLDLKIVTDKPVIKTLADEPMQTPKQL